MASMFSDDAFNKDIDHEGFGTLIGNWHEEHGLRAATGQGRTLPQRHLPRAGLMKDFTKNQGSYTHPSVPKVMDNTFERAMGSKVDHQAHATSKMIGQGCHEAVTAPAPKMGPHGTMLHDARMQQARQEVEDEDKIVDALNHARYFETTTAAYHCKPDETLAEKAVMVRKSAAVEIMCGPTPDRSITLNNDGLNVPSHVHYSNVEGITHARMALADPRMKSDIRASAAGGMAVFGKHSAFSKPMQEFYMGTEKDEELHNMYADLKGTQPMRTHTSALPISDSFKGVPSLAALKSTVHGRIAEVWGAFGYVALRQRFYEHGDSNNMIKKGDAVKVLREELGVSAGEVSEDMLDVYLGGLCTMKKSELKIGSLMSSLRPMLEQKDKRRVLEKFQSLGPQDGQVKLGTWLGQLDDEDLKSVILSAFGASDAGSVAEFPMQEMVFLELFADLAPLADISQLLTN